MIRWTARSVIPTSSAMSRIRTSGSRDRQSSTCAWLVRNVHDGSASVEDGAASWCRFTSVDRRWRTAANGYLLDHSSLVFLVLFGVARPGSGTAGRDELTDWCGWPSAPLPSSEPSNVHLLLASQWQHALFNTRQQCRMSSEVLVARYRQGRHRTTLRLGEPKRGQRGPLPPRHRTSPATPCIREGALHEP